MIEKQEISNNDKISILLKAIANNIDTFNIFYTLVNAIWSGNSPLTDISVVDNINADQQKEFIYILYDVAQKIITAGLSLKKLHDMALTICENNDRIKIQSL